MPRSRTEGAVQGLHGVVQRVVGATPDGLQPGILLSSMGFRLQPRTEVSWAAPAGPSCLNQLVKSLHVPVCAASPPTHNGIEHHSVLGCLEKSPAHPGPSCTGRRCCDTSPVCCWGEHNKHNNLVRTRPRCQFTPLTWHHGLSAAIFTTHFFSIFGDSLFK